MNRSGLLGGLLGGGLAFAALWAFVPPKVDNANPQANRDGEPNKVKMAPPEKRGEPGQGNLEGSPAGVGAPDAAEQVQVAAPSRNVDEAASPAPAGAGAPVRGRAPLVDTTGFMNIGPGDGHWGKLSARLDGNVLRGVLELKSHSTKGFHGAGYVDLMGAAVSGERKLLARVIVKQFGVNGGVVGGTPRVVHFHATLDPKNKVHAEILNEVEALECHVCYGGEIPDAFGDIADKVKAVVGTK